jgi:hypothetical protein
MRFSSGTLVLADSRRVPAHRFGAIAEEADASGVALEGDLRRKWSVLPRDADQLEPRTYFMGERVGVVGDGATRVEPITVMTFESAYRRLDLFGDRPCAVARAIRSIVFTAHVEDADSVAEQNLIPVITGEVGARERQRILTQFKAGSLTATLEIIAALDKSMIVCVDERYAGSVNSPSLVPYRRVLDAWTLLAAARTSTRSAA